MSNAKLTLRGIISREDAVQLGDRGSQDGSKFNGFGTGLVLLVDYYYYYYYYYIIEIINNNYKSKLFNTKLVSLYFRKGQEFNSLSPKIC
jgi:hypothetical protein